MCINLKVIVLFYSVPFIKTFGPNNFVETKKFYMKETLQKRYIFSIQSEME